MVKYNQKENRWKALRYINGKEHVMAFNCTRYGGDGNGGGAKDDKLGCFPERKSFVSAHSNLIKSMATSNCRLLKNSVLKKTNV